MKTSSTSKAELEVLLEISLGSPIGQLRAMPVRLGPGAPRAFLTVHCADFDIDPYVEMFFFPSDSLKMTLLTDRGEIVWSRDLGRAVVPGVWFCPVFPFDLDADGVDELWFVNNIDPGHPLGLSNYRLERVNAVTGESTGQWMWHNTGNRGPLSHSFRNFILGGYANDDPVLVTAQGTYEDMYLQGWRPDMSLRWEHHIAASAPGARGSHMCAICDLDEDGVQEVLWGERCISLDDGRELFCADRDSYRGHSDIVQPALDRVTDHWFVYACRESDQASSPRVALYDASGTRIWGHIDQGHMDLGWVARLGANGAPIAMAVRIGQKTCGPDGRFHFERDEFSFDALTGEPYGMPFNLYGTLPVDLTGDGQHELVRGIPGADGSVVDRFGQNLGSVGAPVAMLSKFVDHPGEQLLSYHADGTIRVWAHRAADDNTAAVARYTHPLYAANQRLTGVGYNLVNLGGI
jgi:hypothetical protein